MEITISEITDKKVWSDFIGKYGQWSLFQTWEWGEIQSKQGLLVRRLGIFDDCNLVGIAQVAVIKARRGTFIHVRQGPVMSDIDLSRMREYLQILLTQLKKMARIHNAWFVRINPMIENSSAHQSLFNQLGFRAAPIHAMDAEVCWVLDLTLSPEKLLQNMRKTTRYSIKHAEKIGVTVDVVHDVNRFLKLYDVTAKRHGFVKHGGIKEEYEIFNKQNRALLLVASYQNEDLASALILFIGKHAIYHHGASIPSKIPASYYLQWRAISEAKKRGMELYNFWGIAPQANSHHPWSGITLFKQGFGGRKMEFVHAMDISLSPFYTISYTIEVLRRIKRGY